MFEMFITGMENESDMFDIDIKIICVPTFLKIQTNLSKYRPNTDQFLAFFLQTTVSSLQALMIGSIQHHIHCLGLRP